KSEECHEHADERREVHHGEPAEEQDVGGTAHGRQIGAPDPWAPARVPGRALDRVEKLLEFTPLGLAVARSRHDVQWTVAPPCVRSSRSQEPARPPFAW